ncbi:MAG: hypothetical protein QGG40_20590, partial [Myxococcota bacterium]|nr:hypothetical protein [Myxococcota bacterium]
GEAWILGLACVSLNALLGALFGLIVGIPVDRWTKGWEWPRRHSLCMAATALLFGIWFMVPASSILWEQGRSVAAICFLVTPIGF